MTTDRKPCEVAARDRYDVDQLKRDHPLAAVIEASGVRLIPSGRGTFRARCPFHDDRTPSLLVDERDGHYHCFGCGAHGDVLDFVMRRDKVPFAEACARLAGWPPLPRSLLQSTGWRERRWDRLSLEEQVVMNIACALYQHALWREPRALAYLRKRGLPDWVIREGALGYADGHSLEAYLRRGSGLKTAQELGLLERPEHRDGGALREFLAGRVVVPELRGGQAIWFVGRMLADDPTRPKYLGLPGERPILGFERAAGQREVFLCEGVLDYLTAVSWKLAAFSPGGTHLPVDRLGFLARARVVWGIFDGDDAGRAAAARFAEHLGARWRALDLPEGSDLNDLGQRPGGRAEFFQLLARARQAGRARSRAQTHNEEHAVEPGSVSSAAGGRRASED